MGVSLDLSTDYLAFDGQQSVSVVSSGVTTIVEKALRREVNQREAGTSNGSYTVRDVKWEIPVALHTTEPALGARITDASSVVWVVFGVDKCTLGTRWRCWCKKLTVTDTTVDVQLGTPGKSVGGAFVYSWSTVVADVGARIQPIDQSDTDEAGHRILDPRWKVYLATDIDVGAAHSIWHSTTGKRYRILKVTGREQLGQLPSLEVTYW